jgi:hypothetical protein
MKLKMMAVVLFLTPWPTFGQQSTTDTHCMVNGQMVDCNSTTTQQAPPSGGWLTGVNKALAANRAKADANRQQSPQNVQQSQLSPEAIKELFAQEKQERGAKDTVDYIYCRQNPKNGITDSDGKPKTCADVIDYTKAFCTVNIEDGRCKLAKSRTDVLKAFASLLDGYNSEKDKNKEHGYYAEQAAKLTRWGCMSFPDMVLPQIDGDTHSCPNAPEAGAVK